MANDEVWKNELKAGIVGIWENEDFRYTFSENYQSKGTVTILSKHTSKDHAGIYDIIIRDGYPILVVHGNTDLQPFFYIEYILNKVDGVTDSILDITLVSDRLQIILHKVA